MTASLVRAFRTLRRRPGFTALAVLTLGLGVGATTTVFSVLDSVLWRPLPFDQPERLVSVLEGGPGDDLPTSPATYAALEEQAGSLENVTATFYWTPVLRGTDRPREVQGLRTTPGLFELLRSRAEMGRTFRRDLTGDPDEDPRVVVLGHDLWQRELGGDPNVLGREISLDGESFLVVAVMPPDFGFPTFWADGAELWAPFVLSPEQRTSHSRFLRLFARLAEGAELSQARAEAALVAERLVQENPGANAGLELTVSPLLEPTVGHARTALWTLFGMVALVLLIACANVASLFLARTVGRRRELAVRQALGAGRLRLLGQLVTEGLVLAALGGVLGVILSAWGLEALVALGPEDLPRLPEIQLDLRSLGFALAVSTVAGGLFGLLPAMTLRGWKLRGALQQGARSGGYPAGDRLRRGLVVAEVALTVALVTSAGLLVRSFHHLSSFDPGFDRHGILTLQLSLVGTRHAEPESQTPFFDALLSEVATVPGVEAAGLINHLPVGDDIWTHTFRISGRPEPPPGETPQATVRVASPGLFDALGIELLEGRTFTDADRGDAPHVALVNQRLVQQYFPDEDPVGQRFRRGRTGDDPEWTIVGVVEDIRQFRLTDEIRPEIVFPYAQNPLSFWAKASLAVRTGTDPAALAKTIQQRLWALEPELSISNVRPMETLLAETIGENRFQAFALALFALLAVVLSMVGVYGVMSYLVAWRRTDIGVRMAVGADRRRVLSWVLGDGLRLAAWGVGIGLGLAWLSGRATAGLLYGVSSSDAPTLLAAAGGLLLFAATAALAPAYRASRLQPVECLREE